MSRQHRSPALFRYMQTRVQEQLFRIIDSIEKPVNFASRDGFARISSIRGLESLVVSLCEEASGTGLPGAVLRSLDELKSLFEGFDGLPVEVKKERIRRAGEILALLRNVSAYSGEDRNSIRVPPVSEVLDRLGRLSTPLRYVKGVGPKLAERLKHKGLSTVEDLLYFLPIRYEDRRFMKRISDLEPGRPQAGTGEVLASSEVRYGRRRVFEAVVSDGSGLLRLKWFNYRLPYMKKRYTPGQRLTFYGTVSVFAHRKEMVHPDVELLEACVEDEETARLAEGIVPVYSQIENFHQKTVRGLVHRIVEGYASVAPGCVPEEVLERCGFIPLKDAFFGVHTPGDTSSVELARKSLVFDELFSLELGLALRRRGIKRESGLAMDGAGRLCKRFLEMLPFDLTGAQKRVVEEIRKDMASPHPMNRLIQGDVGSGKTVVAFMAVLLAVESGFQAAIMAPTEILAEQHFLTTRSYCEALGIESALLTGAMTKSERERTLRSVGEGGVDLVIGTHALIQKGVAFRRLGLAVIDEQHRFGVVQRSELRKKGTVGEEGGLGGVSPDILVMTATPIPRTLSMTVFGDLDVSVIDELPRGRRPVETRILREKDREEAYRIIRDEVRAGGQAYIVYPLVEESEELSLRDATNMKEHLERDVFADFRLALLHGRMKSAEKEAVMKAFKAGEVDILVSTTVVEVGVDVPNATLILIEHAERFGLAQLHQLRGRVGRGSKRSLCLLLAQYTQSDLTWRRLKVLEQTMDGFRIAEEDLRIRGPGDFMGTRQWGMPAFRMQDALADLQLLKMARDEAFRFLERDPELSTAEGQAIKAVLRARWNDRLELAEVG